MISHLITYKLEQCAAVMLLQAKMLSCIFFLSSFALFMCVINNDLRILLWKNNKKRAAVEIIQTVFTSCCHLR